MNISVIIPNLNGSRFLPSCLTSLNFAAKKIHLDLEIIIVDNGSTDDSVLKINKLKHSLQIKNYKLKIIQNSKNFGFASAVNQGINAAIGDYVMVMNNDLTLHPDWFKHVIPAIKQNRNPKVTTFFGKVLNKDGTKIESEGLIFFFRGKALNIHNGLPYIKNLNLKIENYLIWGASASVVIYHKNTLLKVGLFDPKFFAYEEDVDLALRLHLLGYKTLFIPQAISYHLGGGTSRLMGNFRQRMDAKNWIYIIIKNYTFSQIIQNFLPIVEERLRNLSGLIKTTFNLYRLRAIFYLPLDIFSTYIAVLINIPKLMTERKQIQKLLKST